MLPSLHEKIRQVVGPERFVESPRPVALVADEGEISALVKLANIEGFSLLPIGGGTSFPPDYRMDQNTVALVTIRMKTILGINRKNLTLAAESGVTGSDLVPWMEKEGYFVPFFNRVPKSTIGGLISQPRRAGIDASSIGNILLRFQLVLPKGDVVQFGGGTIKDVSGYNMMGLICGARGKFGVITRVIFRVFPKALEQEISERFESPGDLEEGSIPEEPRPIADRLKVLLDPHGVFNSIKFNTEQH